MPTVHSINWNLWHSGEAYGTDMTENKPVKFNTMPEAEEYKSRLEADNTPISATECWIEE